MTPQPQLDVRTENSPDGPVIVVVGEIDPFTASTLDRALDAAQPTSGSRVVVDLAGVDFIDSAGLRRLLVAHRRFRAVSVEFVIRSPSAIVRRVLDITALDSLLTIVD